MDDDLLEPVRVVQEVAPDPHQVVVGLIGQPDAGAGAGVGEEVVAHGERGRQPGQEGCMAGGQGLTQSLRRRRPLRRVGSSIGRCNAIGPQCLAASELAPARPGRRIAHEGDQAVLVVAAHELGLGGGRLAIVGKPVDHLPGLRPPVHIVAQEDDDAARCGRLGQVRLDLADQRLQQVRPPVDVADGEDQAVVRHARQRRRTEAEQGPQHGATGLGVRTASPGSEWCRRAPRGSRVSGRTHRRPRWSPA